MNLVAHATLGDDGKARVILVNKSLTEPISLTLQTARYRTAGVARLVAPSPSAKEGVTFAGASVAPDGSWPAQPVPRRPLPGGQLTLDLPAASAAVVTLE
jgi:hypothetical protein